MNLGEEELKIGKWDMEERSERLLDLAKRAYDSAGTWRSCAVLEVVTDEGVVGFLPPIPVDRFPNKSVFSEMLHFIARNPVGDGITLQAIYMVMETWVATTDFGIAYAEKHGTLDGLTKNDKGTGIMVNAETRGSQFGVILAEQRDGTWKRIELSDLSGRFNNLFPPTD